MYWKNEREKIANCPNCQIFLNFKEKDKLLNNIIEKLPIICQNCLKYGKKSTKTKIEQLKNILKIVIIQIMNV